MSAAEKGNNAPQGGLLALAARFWQVTLYIIAYVCLIVAYIVSQTGGGIEVPVREWVAALPQEPQQLKAVLEQSRVRGNYMFKARSGAEVELEAGTKITLLAAPELIVAVANGTFPDKTLKLYKPGLFWNLRWSYIFTVVNLFGMFGGLFLLLRKPIAQMLDNTSSETAQAVRDARAAQTEAENLGVRRERMLEELQAEKRRLQETLAEEEQQEREHIMKIAKHEAEGLVESVRQSIDTEINAAAKRLRALVVAEALKKAQAKLEQEITPADHETAVQDFIRDLERMAK